MALVVVPFVLPADLKGVKQGFVPDELLRPIKPYGKLYWRAADAWHAMQDAAAKDGIELKPTSAGDTYRSYASQEAAFLQRYTLKAIPGTSTRKWNGKTWHLKKGMAQLAVPGTSMHNWGAAVDCHTASGERLEWLKGNAIAFGWSWEVQSEPWHLRLFNADEVTPAVQMWLANKPAAAEAPAAKAPAADATAPVASVAPKTPKPRKPKA